MQLETNSSADHIEPIAVKSWTAYVKTSFVVASMLGLIVPLGLVYVPVLAIVASMATLALGTYNILSIRNVQLFYDDAGVWVYSGVFPWQKGIYGIKWRDLDEAAFFTGFKSWLFKSYEIRLTHRFTRGIELNLSDMQNGQAAVTEINKILKIMVQEGSV